MPGPDLPPAGEHANLRAQALKGGAYIIGRRGLGMVLAFLSVLYVIRIIGPAQYGIFAAASGIVAFLATFGTWGIEVYLIRKPRPPRAQEYRQAFTLLLCISAVIAAALLALHGYIAAALRMPELAPVLALLILYIPAHLLAQPAMAQLDRELRFKRVAWNELLSQALGYAVAIPLAVKGFGAWAPATGLLTQQVSLLLFSYAAASARPGLHWEPAIIRQMLGYGLSYSSSVWVWQLRTLVNPVVVGRLAGAQAVGYVAFCIRIAEVLAFARPAIWRVAMAVLAKLGDDRDRLRRSVQEGMRLQTLAVGLPLAAFALLAPLVIPSVFGAEWTPALAVFPFIAIGYLCNATFNLHVSVLYLLRRNLWVTWFHLANVGVLAVTAALLVPRLGFVGYGWAELAALSSYGLLHFLFARRVGSPHYGVTALWFAAAAAAILLSAVSVYLGLLGLLLLTLPLLLPGERESINGYRRLLMSRS